MGSALNDETYVAALLAGLRTTRTYRPKMGTGGSVSVEEFTAIYGADPLYHWMGFDSPLMYAAHRASGAMTSLYRNLGTGCEHLFKRLLKDQLGLSDEQIKWEYHASAVDVDAMAGADAGANYGDISEVSGAAEDFEPVPRNNKATKKNSLDGRIDLADLHDEVKHGRVGQWLGQLRSERDVSWDPVGAVFEVRQGYKSMDSKRQAADIANAAQALTRQRLPVLVVFSNQIDDVLVRRYKTSGWGLLRGITIGEGADDPLQSTFAFSEQVLNYDLKGFFQRNTDLIRAEVEEILQELLSVK